MSHRAIATILRHDGKQTSYKIALLRSLRDDVALRFAHADADPPRVARSVAGLIESIATARNLARF
ncbi:MAG: hypothetical protein K0A98_14190 [Trueperaceae bacterium]|nr:hypothetical protein [Trueperaceae bacterium]